MLYRINHRNFLVHMIDWFPLQQLIHIQYAIISTRIPNGGRATNVVRLPFLWPTSDLIEEWERTHDDATLHDVFMEYLLARDDPESAAHIKNQVYQAFLNPLDNHADILLYCHEEEDPIIDVICEFLKKEYALEPIDLNELFLTGHAGPYRIDLDKIHDKAVDVRRWAAREMRASMSSTYDGKAKVIGMMNKKEKKKKFDELGLDPSFIPKHLRDKVLLEEWDRADREDS